MAHSFTKSTNFYTNSDHLTINNVALYIKIHVEHIVNTCQEHLESI